MAHSPGPAGPHPEPRWDQVAARAAHDADFRRALLHDPARALRETLGITLPAGYRVRFVERPRDVDALVVLPDPERDELTDEELDEAAGGDGTWSDPLNPPPPPPPPTDP
ncbi:NHLP leader peptide family RiPP precursor [Longimicrobium sp.]|uniref:NHLP leader peptide family RiPP precursor n=1 Tax=Longimicrobium sp. TaxID=2029185 RepID=UPI002C5891EC|nr:NHLP leader peptide family RiPP precursor [Longimicrobium sp.]HSU14669.1 NHLP leader peptide family RiPP precursor [Longimicrobium sp.]